MKVKVSKVMAEAIAKALIQRGVEFEDCVVDTTSERGYVLNVAGTDGMYDAQDNGDYDWKKDEYKFIRITYPWHFYACPTYLTTKRLKGLFRECHEKTLDCFMDKVCEAVAV